MTLLSTLGKHVWRTGPFAANPNYGRSFNDGYLARKYSDPRSFNDIVSSTATVSGDFCSAIKTQYGTSVSTHPNPPIGTAIAEKTWSQQDIRFIKGCANDRINSLRYSASVSGEGPYDCGTSTEGHGFDGYPFQFAPDRCTYVYWSGKTVKFTDGVVALTDIYFYWQC